jgi:hypothetical protein
MKTEPHRSSVVCYSGPAATSLSPQNRNEAWSLPRWSFLAAPLSDRHRSHLADG